jgi:hypothetical protein
MAEWHYHQAGQQYGPVTFEQLQQMAGSGQLNPTDLVWTESFADWQEARTVQGLFAATGPAPGGPPGPPSGPVAPQPGHYRRQMPQGTPPIVIIGFIFSFFCPLVGFILCLVGMGEAKRRNAGTGLATAGIVISILMFILGIFVNVAANA